MVSRKGNSQPAHDPVETLKRRAVTPERFIDVETTFKRCYMCIHYMGFSDKKY